MERVKPQEIDQSQSNVKRIMIGQLFIAYDLRLYCRTNLIAHCV